MFLDEKNSCADAFSLSRSHACKNGQGVGEGCQSATGVAVCNTVWIIQPSMRVSLTLANTCTQMTPLTSCKSFGMIVTVEPFPSVTSTCPPGRSRMNAPPPSEARMIARIGVGSAVTVDVDVSVAGSVAAVEEGLGVRETLFTEAPMTAVGVSVSASKVVEGMATGVNVGSRITAGSGIGGASPAVPMSQFPKFV